MHAVVAAALGVAATGAAGVGWGLVEAQWFAVRRLTVPVAGLAGPSLRILHLSDLHMMPGQRRKSAWLRSLVSLEPDLVVNTGDNISHPEAWSTLLDGLEPLLTRPGVFVYGSNDYHGPHPRNPLTYFRGPTRDKRRRIPLPTHRLTEAFRDAGWLDLTNTRGEMRVAGTIVSFVGLDDPHIRRDRMPAPGDPRRSDIHVGVVHAPYRRALDALAADGADVILAGHTHGGQVRLPGVGALVTNCDLDRRRARGLHGWPAGRPDERHESAWLHVSAGAGTSPYAPYRFACRPEATLLEIVAAAPGRARED